MSSDAKCEDPFKAEGVGGTTCSGSCAKYKGETDGAQRKYQDEHDKKKKKRKNLRPVKTQSSLIRLTWFSVGKRFFVQDRIDYVDSRLIIVFALRTCHFENFEMTRLKEDRNGTRCLFPTEPRHEKSYLR